MFTFSVIFRVRLAADNLPLQSFIYATNSFQPVKRTWQNCLTIRRHNSVPFLQRRTKRESKVQLICPTKYRVWIEKQNLEFPAQSDSRWKAHGAAALASRFITVSTSLSLGLEKKVTFNTDNEGFDNLRDREMRSVQLCGLHNVEFVLELALGLPASK